MVESIEGSVEPCSTCRAMASSVSCVKLSARQYHWSPGTNKGSKRLCTAGNGAGPTWSSRGWPRARIGVVAASVSSAVPVEHQTIPQTVLRCKCSGNIGAGGITRNAKNPPMYSGALWMNLLHDLSTVAASSSGQNVGPKLTTLTG